MVEMQKKAGEAASFLKGIASPHRLLILCHLSEGEKHVNELVELTKIPQTSVSQHLSKLKEEGIVTFRRDHRTLYYKINNDNVLKIMEILHQEFCAEKA